MYIVASWLGLYTINNKVETVTKATCVTTSRQTNFWNSEMRSSRKMCDL